MLHIMFIDNIELQYLFVYAMPLCKKCTLIFAPHSGKTFLEINCNFFPYKKVVSFMVHTFFLLTILTTLVIAQNYQSINSTGVIMT